MNFEEWVPGVTSRISVVDLLGIILVILVDLLGIIWVNFWSLGGRVLRFARLGGWLISWRGVVLWGRFLSLGGLVLRSAILGGLLISWWGLVIWAGA